MKISFDLDDTLIPSQPNDFPTENRHFLQRFLGIEKIRKGSTALFTFLKQQGHEVGIYTTSYRSPLKIKLQCISYGFSPDFIINEILNQKMLKKNRINCSKYPPLFSIDLHIDDSEGVGIEGDRFRFNTLILQKTDENWQEKIQIAVENQVTENITQKR